MINEHLHQTPTPLDRAKHRELRFDRSALDVSRMKAMNSCFVSVGEFAEVCKEYPLVWVAAGKTADGKTQVAPLAVFGLQQGQNLCIDEGRWRMRYIPALLRFYPFAIARTSPDQMVLCVDESSPALGVATGEALFKSDGEPAEMTAAINRQLSDFEVDVERTRLVGEKLTSLGLLREMRFDAPLPAGNKLQVSGFFTIDEDKLGKLSDAEVLDLARGGVLGLIHAHQISLSNMARLADWEAQRLAQRPPTSAA